MSSRQFILLVHGLLYSPDSREGWFASTVRAEVEARTTEMAEAKERMARAESAAQCAGEPLRMSDLVNPNGEVDVTLYQQV